MNDHLLAIATLEMTRNRSAWTHDARRRVRRPRRSLTSRIAALVRAAAPRRVQVGCAAPAAC